MCLNSKLAASGGFDYIIREVYQELGEAALSCRVVAKHRREGVVSQGLGEALAEGLARTGVIAESVVFWEEIKVSDGLVRDILEESIP